MKTPYIAVFDDDIIPGRKWFENCLTTIDKVNGILGGSGVILQSNAYRPNTKIGWNGIHSSKIEKVDLVGHAWFFRKEWAKYLWYEEPVSWDNGEDIMFSYLSQKHGGIYTFVPPHPEDDMEVWGNSPVHDNNYGVDQHATFLHDEKHFYVRDEICREYISRGWKTINKLTS